MTLVSVPATAISLPQLSRSRYEALPVFGSEANETLHDVLPVERRLNELAEGRAAFLANSGEPGATGVRWNLGTLPR